MTGARFGSAFRSAQSIGGGGLSGACGAAALPLPPLTNRRWQGPGHRRMTLRGIPSTLALCETPATNKSPPPSACHLFRGGWSPLSWGRKWQATQRGSVIRGSRWLCSAGCRTRCYLPDTRYGSGRKGAATRGWGHNGIVVILQPQNRNQMPRGSLARW